MTHEYQKWQRGLKGRTRDVVLDNVKYLSEGNFGHTRHINLDIYEKKIYTGAGYRIYYFIKSHESIILLLGGSKRTQAMDIKKAINIRKELNE